MSLAEQLAQVADSDAPEVRKGPLGACHIYGEGNLEDWEAVEAKRRQGWQWADVQAAVDDITGVKAPIPLAKFKYHWRRRCYCWPRELRRS